MDKFGQEGIATTIEECHTVGEAYSALCHRYGAIRADRLMSDIGIDGLKDGLGIILTNTESTVENITEFSEPERPEEDNPLIQSFYRDHVGDTAEQPRQVEISLIEDNLAIGGQLSDFASDDWVKVDEEYNDHGISTGNTITTTWESNHRGIQLVTKEPEDKAGYPAIRNEYTNYQLFRALGAHVPDHALIEMNGKPTLVTRKIESESLAEIYDQADINQQKELRDALARNFVLLSITGALEEARHWDDVFPMANGSVAFVDLTEARNQSSDGGPKTNSNHSPEWNTGTDEIDILRHRLASDIYTDDKILAGWRAFNVLTNEEIYNQINELERNLPSVSVIIPDEDYETLAKKLDNARQRFRKLVEFQSAKDGVVQSVRQNLKSSRFTPE